MAHSLTRLQRVALRAGLLLMPDDRYASRSAMMRLSLLYWRGSARGRVRRIVRQYGGFQRVWIELGAGFAIYFAASGWWQLPLLTTTGVAVAIL